RKGLKRLTQLLIGPLGECLCRACRLLLTIDLVSKRPDPRQQESHQGRTSRNSDGDHPFHGCSIVPYWLSVDYKSREIDIRSVSPSPPPPLKTAHNSATLRAFSAQTVGALVARRLIVVSPDTDQIAHGREE